MLKRIVGIIVVFPVLIMGVIGVVQAPSYVSGVAEIPKSTEGTITILSVTEPPTPSKYKDDAEYSDFYGRLYIDEVGIDVALYNSAEQYIVDREDSAGIFIGGSYGGWVLADHVNQDFEDLYSVEVGTFGHITKADGTVIDIVCDEVYYGHNAGFQLTDESGNNVLGTHDYVMYTCTVLYGVVLITQWSLS